MRQALARVLWCIHRIEDLLLVGLLLSMISIAFTQIVLRNGFDGGIAWQTHCCVLWCYGLP